MMRGCIPEKCKVLCDGQIDVALGVRIAVGHPFETRDRKPQCPAQIFFHSCSIDEVTADGCW